MKHRNTKRKTNKKKVAIYILGAVVVITICIICGIQISNHNKKNAELEQRKARLEEMLEDEKLRQKELEDEAAYVKTQEFIEDKARSIGYVYPDEIIFKKNK